MLDSRHATRFLAGRMPWLRATGTSLLSVIWQRALLAKFEHAMPLTFREVDFPTLMQLVSRIRSEGGAAGSFILLARNA
jgi:hypothetical protein